MTNELPAGQREISRFPRFGLTKFANRFPQETGRRAILISGNVERDVLVEDALSELPRVEQVSDFHCVTTWTRRALRWGGVRFADFFDQVIRPQAAPSQSATVVILRGQDGARTSMRLEDLLHPDVLLADMLDGKPLTVEHGAPIRVVAPRHYGYKSVKHLSRIEFHRDEAAFRPSAFRFMDHPRARVEFEERGRWVPGLVLRYVYRPLVAITAVRFERSMKKYREKAG